jgi:hypothetical protein
MHQLKEMKEEKQDVFRYGRPAFITRGSASETHSHIHCGGCAALMRLWVCWLP